MNEIEVRFVPLGSNTVGTAAKNPVGGAGVKVPCGTALSSLLPGLGVSEKQIAAIKVNNGILPVSTQLNISASLEPVLINSPEGAMIYRRSLSFLLAMAARDLFPDWGLYVGHSLGNSYYYTFIRGQKPSKGDVERLKKAMLSLVNEDVPINAVYLAYGEARELFKKNGQEDTAMLLDQYNSAAILINKCNDFADIYIEPLVHRTGLLSAFDLVLYKEGFLLRFPGIGRGSVIDPFEDSPLIFSIYDEYKKWGRIVDVHSVGKLNHKVSEGSVQDYIRVAETFQARKLGDIAQKIYDRRDSVRAVFIAGPSSSGKTTTAKRLSIELMVMGLKPIAISLDDYYLGTEKTPRDENGQPDFECLEALDIPFLNRQLLDLFAGREVTLPVFDFKAGRRRETGGKKILMEEGRTILIIEGIHGLNDALTPQIDPAFKFKLYVSALTQLNLDDHNRIPTSDNRLIRRMVRDYQFRAQDAAGTITMWPSVQRGERKHIFPFQNSADAAFNSALDYEVSVLKYYADPLLRAVKPGSAQYSEADRLLSFLGNFAPIPPQYVPGTSILREFIGDSDFKY
jgi:uridine kinase